MAAIRQWMTQAAGGLPRAFWWLWAATLINRIGGFIVIYLSIYLLVIRDFPPFFVGLVVGLYGAGSAVGGLAGGVLADRWGSRTTMVRANLAATGVAVVLGLVTHGTAIAVLAGVLGCLTNTTRPASAAMIADVVPERDRMRAFSLNFWAVNLGFSGAALLGGALAGFEPRLLFFLDAATTLAAALMVWRLPESRPTAGPAGSRESAERSGGLGEVLRDGVFLMLVVTGLLTWMIIETLSMLPVAMRSDGISISSFGTVVAINGIMIVLGQLFVPRLVGNRDPSRVLVLAALLVGTGFGLVSLADQVWMYGFTVAVWTAGEMLMTPTNATLTNELAPARVRGRYNGVSALGFALASFSAPVLAGITVQGIGERALWIGCFALGLAVAGIHLAARPARLRRAAALRAAHDAAATPQARSVRP